MKCRSGKTIERGNFSKIQMIQVVPAFDLQIAQALAKVGSSDGKPRKENLKVEMTQHLRVLPSRESVLATIFRHTAVLPAAQSCLPCARLSRSTAGWFDPLPPLGGYCCPPHLEDTASLLSDIIIMQCMLTTADS